jgi:hypothetical protein
MPVCRQHFPKRTELGGGHWTHCFLYGDGGADLTVNSLGNAQKPGGDKPHPYTSEL